MKIVKRYIKILFIIIFGIIAINNFGTNKSYASDLSIESIWTKGSNFITKR